MLFVYIIGVPLAFHFHWVFQVGKGKTNQAVELEITTRSVCHLNQAYKMQINRMVAIAIGKPQFSLFHFFPISDIFSIDETLW